MGRKGNEHQFGMRTGVLSSVLLAVCLLASCSKVTAPPEELGSLTVHSSVNRTKGLGKNEFESSIYSLSCYLFQGGSLVMKGYADMDGDIEFLGLYPGNYTIVMIAGEVPEIEEGTSYNSFTRGEYYLYAENNGYSSGFNMFGSENVVIKAGESEEVDMILGHCCAKISISRILINYSGVLKDLAVTYLDVNKVFVMDAFSACHLDAGAVAASEWGKNGVGSFNCWSGNRMNFTDDPARYSATCFCPVSGESYPPLYVCPTDGSDSPVSPYLVLETTATFKDSSTCKWYYRICLGNKGRPLAANNEYSFSLLITGPGAESPDKDVPGSIVNDVVSDGESQNDVF